MSSSSISRPKAGRPTRDQAEARRDQLLEAALDHFLEKGFELATIEAIAQHVGMTKRTVYAHHADKVSLFHAAVSRAIERYTLPAEQIEATDDGDIEQTLIAIAWLRVNQVMTPNGLRLQRIINTESYRFPDIFTRAFEQSALPTVAFITHLFERETRAGRLAIAQPRLAADVFMSMVVGGPVRALVLGQTLPRDTIDARIRYAVHLFLEGTRPRGG